MTDAALIAVEDALIERVITARSRRRTRVDGRRHRPRFDGALEVRALGEARADSWTPCDMPDCVASRGGNLNAGTRHAAVGLYVMGRSLGSYCEVHSREMRRAWDAR